MPFLSPLDLRAVGKKDWLLLADLTYKYRGITLTIPKGFVSDLASIPMGFRWLLPVNDRHREPAVVHDYLYRTQATTREDADAIFYTAMIEAGVPAWKRHLIIAGVRAGGWAAWRENARKLRTPS